MPQWLVAVDDHGPNGPSPWLIRDEAGDLDTCYTMATATDFGSYEAADEARQRFQRSAHRDGARMWTVVSAP